MSMQILGIIILLLCIFLLLYSELKKRKTVSLLEHYLQSGEFGDYLTLLDSTFVTLVFPKFNRLYMRLNAYLFMDDEKNALKLLDIMLKMKVSKKQRVDLIVKAFNIYIEQNQYDKAEKLLDEIKTFDKDIHLECKKTFDIFALKKYHYIKEMEDKLSEVSGVNLGFLEYLLSIQYENKGDHKKSEYYLEKSKKHINL